MKNIQNVKISQSLQQDFPKPKHVKYYTCILLKVNHLHCEEKLYLDLLFGKCVLSPSSLSQNGFILKKS